MPRLTNPAANARERVVVDYGPDPADRLARGLLHDAYLRVQGLLVAFVGGADADPERTFSGYGPPLQNFRGAASAAATTVVYRDAGANDIASGLAEAPGDPTRQIFAARLRRGRNVL